MSPTDPSKSRKELPLTVALIGNYDYDEQQSMQRFTSLLEHGLKSRGIDVYLYKPQPFFGKLRPGAFGIAKWLGYIDKFIIFPCLLLFRLQFLQKATTRAKRRLIVHITDHSNAFYVVAAADIPHLITCHDLLAVRSALGEFPQNRTGFTGRILQKLILFGLSKAKSVACVSKATCSDLQRLLPRVQQEREVIPNGLNGPYFPVSRLEVAQDLATISSQVADAFHSDAGYLLHVGGNQWYKNRKGVLHLYNQISKVYRTNQQIPPKLVMVGKPMPSELVPLLTNDSVVLTDLESASLRVLYAGARAVLFPSIQEGFGWPIIEAQACGCPVITTDRPPMSDIAGPGALLLDPDHIEGNDNEMCAGQLFSMLIEDTSKRDERIRLGFLNAAEFSAEKMITHYIHFYMANTAA